MSKRCRFNFQNLDVYQAAVEHYAWSVDVMGRLERAPFKVVGQFLAAPLSTMANVAEASGRDRMPGEAEQHYRYAQGSTYECAAFLDALSAMGLIDGDEYNLREQNLARIAEMLTRLMQKAARRR